MSNHFITVLRPDGKQVQVTPKLFTLVYQAQGYTEAKAELKKPETKRETGKAEKVE
jgi:hypothetical protein